MAKDKPKNGRRTIKGTRARPPGPQHKPTGKKDPGGLDKTFETETKYGGKVKGPPKTGGPPGVKSKEAARAKFMRDNPPPVKYAGKKKAPKRPPMPKWPIDPPKYLRPEQPKKPWPKPKPRKPKKPMPRPKGKRPTPKKPMSKGRAK